MGLRVTHKGYSRKTQLSGILQGLHSSIDAGLHTPAVYLNFSNAFDRITHRRLLLRLHPNVLIWITDFLPC